VDIRERIRGTRDGGDGMIGGIGEEERLAEYT
jgi:hypothetical protein